MNTIAVMDMEQAQAWTFLIASIVTALTGVGTITVTIINAIRQNKKMEEIHKVTNSAMTRIQRVLRLANERVAQLEDFIMKSTDKDVPSKKRKSDVV